MTTTTTMIAPNPGQTFMDTPSGNSYVASADGLIQNVLPIDIVALLGAGCQFQSSGGGGLSLASITNTLATVYTSDQIIVARNGTPYLAPVSAVLAATAAPTGNSGTSGVSYGALKFNSTSNSIFISGVI